jgi:glycosyltransferase involved in cell wall biosynthesis
MPRSKTAVFLINLVQDVNVLRPLIFIASRDFAMDVLLLVSRKFTGRDLFGIWQSELEEICEATGARLELFGDDWEAHRQLDGEGVIFAASESHLHNHVTTHSVFLQAPPSYLKVTLQHGFECVGFRHSVDHDRAHGVSASFGADYVCAWLAAPHLTSMAPSQAGKLVVTGPTALLQVPPPSDERARDCPGLVCENLHSVRLNGAGDFKGQFVDAFSEFCRCLRDDHLKVALRPHPGGQYMLKNKIPVPDNAILNNAPMYRVDLGSFAYGISAPSSVLIDMLLARIPTAVWRDHDGNIDADNYAGLTTVSTPAEWVEFARKAIADPGPFLDVQDDFLRNQGMILDPAEIYARYAQIFRTVLRTDLRPTGARPERERILFIANANVPTLQLSFEKPLEPLVARGEITTRLLTDDWLSREQPTRIEQELNLYSPSAIVFCRYSGAHSRPIMEWAERQGVPAIYHIDDDLLAIPPEVGLLKHSLHNSRQRLSAVRELLTSVDLVYASTDKLRCKLLHYYADLPVVAGKIYCSGRIIRRPRSGPAKTIGYMASADHAHNLEMILPAIERVLDRNPDVRFELFGSIPIPTPLERFSHRISTTPPVKDYSRFLSDFAARRWDVGICPLNPIEFNLMKADTKWVEYTSAGAAVVASRDTVYDRCCADGCGILADGVDEWAEAIELLIRNGEERASIAATAQDKLERDYGAAKLREQVLEVLAAAHAKTRGKRGSSRRATAGVSGSQNARAAS